MSSKFTELTEKYSKEYIENLYKNNTMIECANLLNITDYLFARLVDWYHIPRNGSGPKKGTSKLDKALARINKEEFVKDYLENNLRREDMQRKYDIPEIFVFEELVRYYDCKKDASNVIKLSYETGIKNAGSKEEYNKERFAKRKATIAKKYNSFESKVNCINKEEFIDDYINKNMSHQDMQTKYNVTSWTLDKLIEHFNCHKSRTQSAALVQQTKYEQAGSKEEYVKQCTETTRQTKIEKYGSEEAFKECFRQGIINKYGDFETYTKMQQEKAQETKRNNKTFNTSKPEDDYYEYLKTIYHEDDIIRQYKDERYPFSCDFYIKSQDLFIECNFHWTHGGHLFDENNPDDIAILEDWQEKAKTSDFYKNAIYTWTNLDVRKQKIAEENNLNYQALY